MARKITVTKTGTWYHGICGRKKIGPGTGDFKASLHKSTYKPPRKKRNESSMSLFSWLTGIPDKPVKKTRSRNTRTAKTSYSPLYSTSRLTSFSGSYAGSLNSSDSHSENGTSKSHISSHSQSATISSFPRYSNPYLSTNMTSTPSSTNVKEENGCVYVFLFLTMFVGAIGWCVTSKTANKSFFETGTWTCFISFIVLGFINGYTKLKYKIIVALQMTILVLGIICLIGSFCSIFTGNSHKSKRHHRRKYNHSQMYIPSQHVIMDHNTIMLTNYNS